MFFYIYLNVKVPVRENNCPFEQSFRGTGALFSIKSESREIKGLITAFHVLPYHAFGIEAINLMGNDKEWYILSQTDVKCLWINKILDITFMAFSEQGLAKFNGKQFYHIKPETVTQTKNSDEIRVLQYANGESLSSTARGIFSE